MPTLAYPWGIVKILDMGLARCTEAFAGRAATHLTQIGSVMGTPEFIAPEQARDSHTSDVRADLYSLGCTLYFLLTGQPPFPNGTLTEKLIQHQIDEPESVAFIRRERLLAWRGVNGPEPVSEERLHVPKQVDRVVRRLLEKNPDDRYQTPIELANELKTLVTQMANGTLEREDDEATTETASPLAAYDAPLKLSATDSALAMKPLVCLAPCRPTTEDFAGKIVMVLAMLGGLVTLFLVTVIAALMWR